MPNATEVEQYDPRVREVREAADKMYWTLDRDLARIQDIDLPPRIVTFMGIFTPFGLFKILFWVAAMLFALVAYFLP